MLQKKYTILRLDSCYKQKMKLPYTTHGVTPPNIFNSHEASTAPCCRAWGSAKQKFGERPRRNLELVVYSDSGTRKNVHEKTSHRLQEGQGSGKGGVNRLSLRRYIASIPSVCIRGTRLTRHNGHPDDWGSRFVWNNSTCYLASVQGVLLVKVE